ncbi:MAG: McrC family protein [Prevotella sp.]|nr:McrC family protein [Prevotella sp.]
MEKPIKINDNNWEGLPIDDEQCLENLQKIASKPIGQLNLDDNPNLLIFPQNFDEYGDKIGKEYICEVCEGKLFTKNIMGFIGYGHTKLRIHSRFAHDDDDYFLHYMLQKVFSINLFDLKYHADEESVFDFLVYLFPVFLKRAIRQGIYKEYQTHDYNDTNIRGRVDIGKYIRQNIPFTGKIAYSTREYAYDNHVTELIRHAIEFISNHPYGGGILQNDNMTKDAVSLIREATPRYNKNDRRKVINQNLRPLSHPYFGEYRHLQRLCVQILRNEEIKYGRNDDEIYGVLFDGAWLWEEYLNTILKECGFIHPQNKISSGRKYIFEGKKAPCYPDFYQNDIVLDAKYKRYAKLELSKIDRDDLYQVITYMYIMQANYGGFIVPRQYEFKEHHLDQMKLVGYGGRMNIYGIIVDAPAETFKEYREIMLQHEKELMRNLMQYVNGMGT